MNRNYVFSSSRGGYICGTTKADHILGFQGNLLRGTTEVLLIKFTLHFLEQ